MLKETNPKIFNDLVEKCKYFTKTLTGVFRELNEKQTSAYLEHPANIHYSEIAVRLNLDGDVGYTYDDLHQVVALVAKPINKTAEFVSNHISSDLEETKAKIAQEVFHYAMWCMLGRETLPVKTEIQKVIRKQILDSQKLPKADYLAFLQFMTQPPPPSSV